MVGAEKCDVKEGWRLMVSIQVGTSGRDRGLVISQQELKFGKVIEFTKLGFCFLMGGVRLLRTGVRIK